MKFVTYTLGLLITMVFFSAQPMAKEAPATVEGTRTITTEEAKMLFDSGIIFIDVRNDSAWDAGRIPGSVHLNSKKTLSDKTLTKVASKEQEIVIYCNGPLCLRASKACKKAVSWGYSNIRYFRDGYPAWSKTNNPIE